ncbi:hypothetical protein VB264_12625 [Arcicella aquatica]|uniref:Uncharacterized protein n=1 Tax=Arcicella aquatica TaxID=217141 RepID=A0ABU5QNP2_9BACT|nr:hypothetical protein [Arcicella aquatica]MEA5258633.1 hypothetical protein [Arcicella aquatica]
MKKKILFTLLLISTFCVKSFAEDIDPIELMPMKHTNVVIDNPKGKLKIKFVFNDYRDTGDTTKPKSLFAKLKNIVNGLLDASDNPPFKVRVVREKKN